MHRSRSTPCLTFPRAGQKAHEVKIAPAANRELSEGCAIFGCGETYCLPRCSADLEPFEADSLKKEASGSTSTTGTEPLLFEILDERQTAILVSYEELVLGDYDFIIAARVERERPAVGDPVFASGGGAGVRIGRAV